MKITELLLTESNHFNIEKCPHCGGKLVSESLVSEKKDSCYYKVKSRYKVWPSAYASGALVKCRKKGAKNWGKKTEAIDSALTQVVNELTENLNKWFKEKWVRFGPDGKIRGDCARASDKEGKPKCLPQSKAHSLSKKERASAAARKRREDPNPERSGKAINVNTKKKSNEGVSEVSEDNNLTANKIFFARSNKTPKGWSYDHIGFITQDGKQIQMSGHKGNDVYVTNAVTDDPEFPKQNIKIVSLSKPVSVPTTNSVGAENCGTFVANVLQANGIKGIDKQKIYSVFKKPQEQGVAEGYLNTTFNVNTKKK